MKAEADWVEGRKRQSAVGTEEYGRDSKPISKKEILEFLGPLAIHAFKILKEKCFFLFCKR